MALSPEVKHGTATGVLLLVWVFQTLLRPQLVDPYTWQWGVAVVFSGLLAAGTGICAYLWYLER